MVWNKGLTKENDTRLKIAGKRISQSLLGHTPWNKGLTKETDKRIRNATKSRVSISKGQTGRLHPSWKGNHIEYSTLHVWIKQQKGVAKEYKCVQCGMQASEWSNIDHKYRRVLDDYQPLCRKCHAHYDTTILNIANGPKIKNIK